LSISNGNNPEAAYQIAGYFLLRCFTKTITLDKKISGFYGAL